MEERVKKLAYIRGHLFDVCEDSIDLKEKAKEILKLEDSKIPFNNLQKEILGILALIKRDSVKRGELVAVSKKMSEFLSD